MKNPRIKEQWAMDIIREEYQNAKRTLNPLMNGWHFSAVKFYWLKREQRKGGVTWYAGKHICFNKKYQDGRWDREQFRRTLRHEIVHLVQRGHGKNFLHLLEKLKGSRFTGQPAYEKPKQ